MLFSKGICIRGLIPPERPKGRGIKPFSANKVKAYGKQHTEGKRHKLLLLGNWQQGRLPPPESKAPGPRQTHGVFQGLDSPKALRPSRACCGIFPHAVA